MNIIFYKFSTLYWFVYGGISCLLILSASIIIMYGLTLGLMSFSIVQLKITEKWLTYREKTNSFVHFF